MQRRKLQGSASDEVAVAGARCCGVLCRQLAFAAGARLGVVNDARAALPEVVHGDAHALIGNHLAGDGLRRWKERHEGRSAFGVRWEEV